MAADRTRSGTPFAEVPALGGQLNPPAPGQVPGTLASKLVPIVDKLRRLNSTFGIRPYRVFLVHVAWGGSRSGEGQPNEISRVEIVPTPRVREMTTVTEALSYAGLTEVGGLTIDEISARFTEDDLMGMTPDLADPPLPKTNQRRTDFFWEVVENRPSDPQPRRRRFVPFAVPSLSRDGFEWKVVLTKQDYDRGRDGNFNPRAT